MEKKSQLGKSISEAEFDKLARQLRAESVGSDCSDENWATGSVKASWHASLDRFVLALETVKAAKTTEPTK